MNRRRFFHGAVLGIYYMNHLFDDLVVDRVLVLYFYRALMIDMLLVGVTRRLFGLHINL